MSTKKVRNHSSNRNLPTILCECGHKILLLPDVKAMGQAIEEHALEHKRKYALTEEETEALENGLIAQALDLISKQNNSK
jgi:hypothetical protein